ncbi:efflux RND transporter periplasmic adaptor subunit [Pseudomarimonas arenosa]|uniref:Efflux RND transporter periplasmic adaptor subunit n=1 Tax=Pseudomarimonas arenosa TaxID=2774145 RepID=A0AAW3ZEP4_9GAMM|nr:efflux RND transporter periplasmic adaptor subunit [Pseudomarimonas arenosa]MBD8524638.1 efflux RND transporter periplasmic adaptor subunit [Pseudomarimonas arenosa]
MRSPILIALLSLALVACGHHHDDELGHADADTRGHGHGHNDHAEEEVERGTHGGRLLRGGTLTVELAIYEEGVPPEYRAWLYRDGEPLPPQSGSLEVELSRLGGATDTHRFAVRGDHLVGNGMVYEPHSFDVTVRAEVEGQRAEWQFESHEGRTRIAAEIAEAAGIRVAAAGPGVIRDEHELQGLLTPIEGRHSRVGARFPGPIRSVTVGVGDRVQRGQTLATVESNVSLASYAVAAPIDGVVLARNAAVGEIAGEATLFEIADLSALWVDVHLFGGDAQHITPGLPIEVIRMSDDVSAITRLERVLPVTATASQSTVGRAVLDNADGRWRPGAAVRARVTVSEHMVPLTVPLAALQRFRDWDVVFIRVGEDYEIRPLQLGRRDGLNVEVLEGLKPGDPIVVEQSYLVKADIEKAGASHDH